MGRVALPTEVETALRKTPRRFLITGVGGFIGSHLLERLLVLEQEVVGIDNFSTGSEKNINDVRHAVGEVCWRRSSLVNANICDYQSCFKAAKGCHIILHQAALGSVPRSIKDPLTTTRVNVEGFCNIAWAAKENKVERVVYASSSSVYGDSEELPKREGVLGNSLSPYAASKRTNELFADAFVRSYGLELVGLRYFNIFGPRQDPSGPYAAVIPRWILAMLSGQPCTIFGDGTNSRDFCFIENVIQANLICSVTKRAEALNRVYNIAVGEQTNLNELYQMLSTMIASRTSREVSKPNFEPFRVGDVKHSLADISLAKNLLGYIPGVQVREGLERTVNWFIERGL